MNLVYCILGIAPFTVGGALLLLRRRTRYRLRKPQFKGVPLPQVDDPRWSLVQDSRYWAMFKGKPDTPWRDAVFAVAYRDGEVRFEGVCLGFWKAYARAVVAPLQQRQLEARVDRALKAMDSD